jgi:hypothetical protein
MHSSGRGLPFRLFHRCNFAVAKNLSVLIAFMCFRLAAFAQQSPQRDASGITFLSQAISSAGGTALVRSIQDFTAQGTITHFWEDTPEQGNLTVKARGLGQFRLDSILPEGTWSFIVSNGAGELVLPDGTTNSIAYHNLLNVGSETLPISKVNAALPNPTATIIDLGLVQFGGGQARRIRYSA